MITKEELAARLTGREYGHEIFPAEEKEAMASGLLVIFGYSDDNVEFRGIFCDEYGCSNGSEIYVHSGGVLESHEEPCQCRFCRYEECVKKCSVVTALWCKEPDYSWTYKTDVPHATFEIVEDGEPYCRGIVIDRKDLPTL